MIQNRSKLYFLKKPFAANAGGGLSVTLNVSPELLNLDRSGAGSQATFTVSVNTSPVSVMSVALVSSDLSVGVSPATVVFGPGLPLSVNLVLSGSTFGPSAVTVTATPSDPGLSPKSVNVTRTALTLPVQTNVAIWLTADGGVIKRGGGFAALTDDPVQGWQDRSTNGQNLSQATLSAQPLFKPTGLNGLPGVMFDGVDDLLTGVDGALPLGTSARTVVLVVKWNQFVSSYGGLSWGANSSNFTFGLVKWSGTSPNAGVQGWGTDYQSSYAIQAGTAFLWVITLSGGVLNQRINRSNVMFNTSAVLNTVSANFRMGAETNTSGFQALTVSELLVYNRLLSGSEITQLETYASRWGV